MMFLLMLVVLVNTVYLLVMAFLTARFIMSALQGDPNYTFFDQGIIALAVLLLSEICIQTFWAASLAVLFF